MAQSSMLSQAGREPPTPAHEHDKTPSFGPLSWLLVLSRATYITCQLACKAIRAIPPSRRHGLTFHEYVSYEGMRDYQCGLDAVGIQHLLPPTTTTCRRYARRHKIPFAELRLSDGSVAAWLGPLKPHRGVTVFFHGGGYMAPALPQHLDLATGFRNSKLGEDCAVVVLEYALASERRNHYPTQLRQAAYLLRHLLHVENVPPASITLVGDSAGGNLLLGLLLHITHPNPAVPVVSVNGRFARAAVISPWLELGVPSFSSQKVPGGKQDIITPSALTYWARNLLADGEADPWNSPLSAPRDWWGDLPVDDVLVTYGGSELFRDDVARLVEMLRSEFPRTMTVAACEGEIHVHMLMNRFLKIRKPCQSEDIFVTWMEG